MAAGSRFPKRVCLSMVGAVLTLVLAGCGRTGPELAALAAPGESGPAKAKDVPVKNDPNANKPAAGETPAEADDEPPFRRRHPAPSLEGGVSWINSAGPIDLKDLRGKWVILDFWTYCCINCMHILPELKKLEHAHPNDLVVIGVHSAKFDAEKDSKNILEAVLRHEIEHPVVNDADHRIWDNYDISAWPSLRIIDPEGFLVAGHSAEFEWELIDQFLKEKTAYYQKKGLMNLKPIKFDQASATARQTPLRFPTKVLADEKSGWLFISDSNHNRIVIAGLDGKLLDTIGNGAIGKQDGNYATATFDHPQGMALRDETLYVADTENHLIRKIDLKVKQVTTIAGLGRQGRSEWPGLDLAALRRGDDVKLPDRFYGVPKKTVLNSPWDIWLHKNDMFIAMAGPHQIWRMPLDESEIGVYAGNGREDIVDGPLVPDEPYERGYSSFAQPSGLTGDGDWLYVADSEGSSIRAVPFDVTKNAEVKTIVGTNHLRVGRLFQFGDVDGEGEKVRLQHCLGVALHEGLIYIADTYNSKIKVLDPKTSTVKTIVDHGTNAADPAGLNEPSGLSIANGKLYVADANHHAIKIVDLKQGNKVSTLDIAGLTAPNPPTASPKIDDKPSFPRATEVAVAAATVKPVDGHVRFAVKVTLPPTFKINPLAPMQYLVEGVEVAGFIDRAAIGKGVKVEPAAAEFEIKLPVADKAGEDKVRISVGLNYCQDGDAGVCKISSVVFVVPLKIAADAPAAVVNLEYEAP